MKIIGILGGVASGKSVVAQRLEQLGAEVLDADVVAHEVLREDDVKNAIRDRFGADVINTDGDVDRSALAKIVFAHDSAGRQALVDLEAILHPRIGQRLQQRMDDIKNRNEAKAIVLDAAVMMKAGWHTLCNLLLFVDTSPEIRSERAKTRGWSPEEVAKREARQTPLPEKRAAADVIIDNSGDKCDTFAQVDRFWNEYLN